MKQMHQIANILRSRFRLIAMPTQQHHAVVGLMDDFGRKTGQPIYLWRKDLGLHRLGDQHIIADTVNPLDVIEFIRNSVHFGVYLLQDFPIKRGGRLSIEIKRLLANQASKARVVLLGSHLNIDQSLMPMTLMVECCNEEESLDPAALAQTALGSAVPGVRH